MSATTLGARDRATLALVATFPLAATRALALLAGYGTARDGWRALDRLREAGFVTPLAAPYYSRSSGSLWWPTRAGRALIVAPSEQRPEASARYTDRPAHRLLSPALSQARAALYALASALLLDADSPAQLCAWECGYQLQPMALPPAWRDSRAARVRWPARLGFTSGGDGAAHELLLLPILAPVPIPTRWQRALAAWSAAHIRRTEEVTHGSPRCAEPRRAILPNLIIAAPPAVADEWRATLGDAARVLTWPQIDATLERATATPLRPRITIEPAAAQTMSTRTGILIALSAPNSVAGPSDSGLGECAKRILGLLARHPFLTVAEIAILQGRAPASVRRLCGRLRHHGLLRVLDQAEYVGFGGHAVHLEATREGLSLAARREGLSLAAALAREGFAGGGPGDPLGARHRLLATFAHTRGCAAFVVALARAGRRPDTDMGYLSDWRNVVAAGTSHARPDAVVAWYRMADGVGFQVWLEFDRGTERGAALARKFRAYAREVEGREAMALPTLLIVTTTRAAESRLADEVAWSREHRPALSRLPILLTTTAHLAADPSGPLGTIWRSAEGEESLRRRWPP